MATFKNDRRVEVMSATGETVTAAYLLGIGEGRSMLKGMKARGEVIDADGLIHALEQLLTKKRQIKLGAMQELLTGKRRLPGFVKRWNEVKLRQLGNFLKGSGIKREEALSGDLPCVRYGEIYTTHSDYIRRFSSWISPAVASSATLLHQGDLLFAGSGETKVEIGKCVAFLEERPAYAGGDIVILRPTVDADSMYLGYLLNTPGAARQKASKGQGDAVVHISANSLGEVEVVLPEPSEQAAIAKVLFDIDGELADLEARLTKARALKQAMAQALLTEMKVDAYFLEYDDERSGDFAPLRHVPRGVKVVLGLVTTKFPRLETVDGLMRRIDDASRFVPLEDLALSPQCGFASTVEGNIITPEDQWHKLERVVEVARRVWGDAR